MTVKIVTDSSADLPAELVQELGITVVPLYVRFGEEVYREQVEISLDEFYQRLEHDPIHPVTIQPSPQDFINAYQKLSQEADGIVSIHISSKLSGTCNSALQGKEMIEKGCPIEVIDSQVITVGLGMICTAAARMAKAGESLPSVASEVKQMILNIHLLCLLDTLKLLERWPEEVLVHVHNGLDMHVRNPGEALHELGPTATDADAGNIDAVVGADDTARSHLGGTTLQTGTRD